MNTATISTEATVPPATTRSAKARKVLLPLSILALLISAIVFLPVGEWIRSATAWVESLGFWAPLAFIIIYALAVVFFVPASVLTAGSGAIFGVFWGSVYVSIASTLGATIAFLIGRHLAGKWVEDKIQQHEQFNAISDAVADEGAKIVGLTRLSPIFPFTLLNYAYGVTRVKLSHFVLASWLGMMPGTILYVYIGSIGKAASEAGSKSPAEWSLYGVGLLATLVVTIYITKIARKALQKKINS